MDTYCARSWNYFLFDLANMEQRVCCKTPWKPMVAGEDWFNGPAIKSRRQDQLQGRKPADCRHCWDLEANSQWSPRQGTARPTLIPQSLDSYDDIVVEINLGNTCDMACRYCGPRSSSIWALRHDDTQYNKEPAAASKQRAVFKDLHAQFYNWLLANQQKIHRINLTGGEPFLIQDTYDILEKISWHDVEIVFNTNLNTPDRYLSRIESLLDKLVDQGNTIYFRVSVDGVGNQNDWQRQNCNWERWRDNWLRLGSKPVIMRPALTLTPLTLESMPALAQFVFDSRSSLCNAPIWDEINPVVDPPALDPAEWFGSFRDELQHFQSLLSAFATSDLSHANVISEQISTWLALPSDQPSIKQTRLLTGFLDDSQARWGGGDWRAIYPKTAAIAAMVQE